ncbi:MAG: GTPase HflX [Clostridia bacterium]|nr:GTPase HflX [Clostridia bacterium]
MVFSTEKQTEKAFLVGVIYSNKEDVKASLKELERLAETAGVEILGSNYQLIREVTPATLIGEGKVQEILEQIKNTGANLVIFDCELSGSQAKNLSEIFEIKVIDRITLILDIFAKRATSNEGKLQVELAQLKYNLPRLSSISGTSGRFGSGGVGMRGPGETKLELNKRIAQGNIYKLEKEIEKIKQNREIQKKNRNSNNVFKVAIVGYTNAGKSTLLNLISKAGIYADDKLFATLDTTSRNVYLEYGKQIVLTDTVGFINKLPHNLVDAFASTLEEAKDANLILHIIDSSNVNKTKQIEVVENVLKENNITAPIINVYNKCDLIEEKEDVNGIYISAKNKIGIENLKAKIIEFMK